MNFWQEQKSPLRGYIAKRVQDNDAFDDIVQDVYLKAHTNLSTVRSRGTIAGWLFRIASNAIADHCHSQKPWDELPNVLAESEPKSDYVAELATCLQPLIAELP